MLAHVMQITLSLHLLEISMALQKEEVTLVNKVLCAQKKKKDLMAFDNPYSSGF
jgi:hypothetical protein